MKDSLEEVIFEGKDLMMMESGRFSVEKLSKLKIVKLISLHHKGLHFLKRLRQLETLVVEGGSIQVLFSLEGLVGEEQFVLVKHLELSDLYNLKHIWKSNQHSPLNQSLLRHLETLRVQGCNNLINIAPSSSSFKNLSTLHVRHCKGMVNLVTASTARTMVHLTEIQVTNCSKMKEIVAMDTTAENETICFDKLKSLQLHFLPTLTSFCSADHAFSFSSLERLLIHDCYRFMTFSGGSLSTPKLRRIEGMTWKGNVNDTVKNWVKNWVRIIYSYFHWHIYVLIFFVIKIHYLFLCVSTINYLS